MPLFFGLCKYTDRDLGIIAPAVHCAGMVEAILVHIHMNFRECYQAQ